MPRYLISFDDGSMDHIAQEDLPAVSDATHAVAADAKRAGVWIFGAGILRQRATIVAPDGSITDGPDPEDKVAVGGFAILELGSREDAHAWATRLAAACQCAQEVREIAYDPQS